VSRILRTSSALAAAALLAPASSAFCQQSDLSISPFVTFMPSAGASPMAGLALALAGSSGFSVRAGAHMALENTSNDYLMSPGSFRPWGADADAIFTLGSRSLGGPRRGIAPYAFVGIGTANNSGSVNSTDFRSNWSYGAGLAVPLGSAIDAFGEARWRMSEFVLPTASLAPSPTNEFRVGLSFHVGNKSDSATPRRRPRSRATVIRTPGVKSPESD
jgi:hypothetical protein